MSLKYYGLAILFFSTISCDGLVLSELPEYPSKIEPLGLVELDQLNKTYQSENNDHMCSTLNEYGFTGFSRILFPNDENPCLSKEVVRVEISNSDSLIQVAKEILLKNQVYTNVSDTSSLELLEVTALPGCTICEGPDVNSVPIEWKITFFDQEMNGVTIRDSEITVFIDADGVNRIWGNWYPEFEAPGLINIGYIEAQRLLVGWEFDMTNYTGRDELFIVNNEHTKEQPVLEFSSYINDGILELRKTWKVFISYPDEEFDGWVAYVDVIDGLLLEIETSSSNRNFKSNSNVY